MKKYYIIAKISAQRLFEYRMNVFAYRFGHMLMIALQLMIWSLVYRQTEIFAGMTYSEMISYVLFGNLISALTNTYGVIWFVEQNIRKGSLNDFLTKPYSYFGYLLSYIIGRMLLPALTACFFVLIFIFFYSEMARASLDFRRLFLVAGFLANNILLNTLIAYLFGMIAFWTTQIEGVNYALQIANRLLSGALFPLQILPSAYKAIAFNSPFPYIFFIPTQILIGKMPLIEGLHGFIMALAWTVGLFSLCRLVWHFGLRKYEGVGI